MQKQQLALAGTWQRIDDAVLFVQSHVMFLPLRNFPHNGDSLLLAHSRLPANFHLCHNCAEHVEFLHLLFHSPELWSPCRSIISPVRIALSTSKIVKPSSSISSSAWSVITYWRLRTFSRIWCKMCLYTMLFLYLNQKKPLSVTILITIRKDHNAEKSKSWKNQ